MTDNYPTTLEELRRAFIVTYLDPAHPADVLDARFDRFIAKMQAAAWDEGHTAGSMSLGAAILHGSAYEEQPNPYRPTGEVA